MKTLLATLALTVCAHADTPDITIQTAENLANFQKLQTGLLKLAAKLERSPDPEDRAKAKVVYAAVNKALAENVENQFKALLNGVKQNNINKLISQDQQLTKNLNDILAILMTEDDSVKKQIRDLERTVKEVTEIKNTQENIRAGTEIQKICANKLAKKQAENHKKLQELLAKIGQQAGKDNLKKAGPLQKNAEDNLNKGRRVESAEDQDKTIDALEAAIKEMQNRLEQLREEETLKMLATVEQRIRTMLALQIEVCNKTKELKDKLTTADHQKAQQLGDEEKNIVAQADLAIKLLQTEGSGSSFAMILQEVAEDMTAVQNKLTEGKTGKDTQEIEENIISVLTDMLEAVKQAKQKAREGNVAPNKHSNAKPTNRKLVDVLAELKLIRTLQKQVNARTNTNDLINLAQRQAKIREMVDNLTK